MQNWIISANSRIYNYSKAFEKRGYVDWRQSSNCSPGDIVFIYCAKPDQKIMYKTIVETTEMSFDEIIDDKELWNDEGEYLKSKRGLFMRLRLIRKSQSSNLSLANLMDKKLLKAAPQGPIKPKDELVGYINGIMDESYV